MAPSSTSSVSSAAVPAAPTVTEPEDSDAETVPGEFSAAEPAHVGGWHEPTPGGSSGSNTPWPAAQWLGQHVSTPGGSSGSSGPGALPADWPAPYESLCRMLGQQVAQMQEAIMHMARLDQRLGMTPGAAAPVAAVVAPAAPVDLAAPVAAVVAPAAPVDVAAPVAAVVAPAGPVDLAASLAATETTTETPTAPAARTYVDCPWRLTKKQKDPRDQV